MSRQAVCAVDQRNQLDQVGTIDYLVIGFPGARLTGEGLRLLVNLVERRIIRVFDLVFVTKPMDGAIGSVDVGSRTLPSPERGDQPCPDARYGALTTTPAG